MSTVTKEVTMANLYDHNTGEVPPAADAAVWPNSRGAYVQ